MMKLPINYYFKVPKRLEPSLSSLNTLDFVSHKCLVRFQICFISTQLNQNFTSLTNIRTFVSLQIRLVPAGGKLGIVIHMGQERPKRIELVTQQSKMGGLVTASVIQKLGRMESFPILGHNENISIANIERLLVMKYVQV